MGFTCGIIGLPNVGKSTIFNAITSARAAIANYPFTTIEPHAGVVAVPDKRLDVLAKIFKPPKAVPTTLEFVDIAGLVKGASKGEGLGNQFLSHIRNVDAIAHVVRCFEDENVAHVTGSIDPKCDIEIVETELIIKDLETVEKKLHELERKVKSGEKKLKLEFDVCYKLRDHLGSGRLARSLLLEKEEKEFIQHLHLLTNKPVMYIANVDEKALIHDTEYVKIVRNIAAQEGAKETEVCGKMEAEIANMSYQEREIFLQDLGLQESGLDKVVREGYPLLNLITFFTHNEKELHAWTIPNGTKAPQAAGKIHSDFEKGFIRAEVMRYADLEKFGSEHTVREKGLLAIHGHDYTVKDGDVMYFRFNV